VRSGPVNITTALVVWLGFTEAPLVVDAVGAVWGVVEVHFTQIPNATFWVLGICY
jgi:hypothetical protein